MTNDTFYPIVTAILEYNNYNSAPFEKKISGSGYGSPLQQVVLRTRHADKLRPEKPEDKINLVMGTAAHFLLEYADVDKYLELAGSEWRVFDREQSMHWIHEPTQWVFTGTYDLMLINDKGELMVCDMKTMRTSTGVNFDTKYGKQLSIYAFLANKFYNRTVLPKGLVIGFDKTKNKLFTKLVNLTAPEPEKYAEMLEHAFSLPDEHLPQCSDKETNYGKLCQTYCSVKHLCHQIKFAHNPFDVAKNGLTSH